MGNVGKRGLCQVFSGYQIVRTNIGSDASVDDTLNNLDLSRRRRNCVDQHWQHGIANINDFYRNACRHCGQPGNWLDGDIHGVPRKVQLTEYNGVVELRCVDNRQAMIVGLPRTPVGQLGPTMIQSVQLLAHSPKTEVGRLPPWDNPAHQTDPALVESRQSHSVRHHPCLNC